MERTENKGHSKNLTVAARDRRSRDSGRGEPNICRGAGVGGGEGGAEVSEKASQTEQ